jgi:apolipoprotein N-acyltransferase
MAASYGRRLFTIDPRAAVVGFFPGLFALLIALAIRKWGSLALVLAPIFWPALEWTRLVVTGQLWNALGYSQAYNPLLIQAATWGGVYAVSFLILIINSAIVLLMIRRDKWAFAAALVMIVYVAFRDTTVGPESQWNTSTKIAS